MKKLLLVFGVSILLLTGCSATNPTQEDADYQFLEISEAEFAESLREVDSRYDEFEEVTAYSLVTMIRGDVQFVPTVEESKAGSLSPRLAVVYRSSDWIFFDSMDVRVNDETISLFSNVPTYDKYTDVEGPGVTEVYSDPLTDEEVGLLNGLTPEDGAKFRLSGTQGSVEREFTLEELDAFKTVLNVYIGLKQGLASNK